jgi:hypothetical protein
VARDSRAHGIRLWVAARADVRPFLEHEGDRQLVSREVPEQLLI